MNRKHRATLAAVFDTPTRSGLRFEEVKALLLALGAECEERAGSRVAFTFPDGPILHIHRPHKPKTLRHYQVEQIRDVLDSLGHRP